MASSDCELCRPLPHIVHEFETSILRVGSHQLFAGYCVLVSRQHAREPFDLPETVQLVQHRELLRAARALQQAYAPWKINYSCYGNQVPHVHWHLFPRYADDALRLQPPWTQSGEFAKHATTDAQARSVIERLQKALASLA